MNLLLVEDDARIAEFLRRGLEGEAHTVFWVASGADGIKEALSRRFDLLVLDVMLPDASGLEVCQRLRAEGFTAPVLMLTALSDVQDRVSGLRAGADDYLVKPFAFSELLARIDALARRANLATPPSTSVLRAGKIELNLEAHEARCAGQLVELTAKEFALLRLLMERAGKVVTRATALDQVWGFDADPLTNVVDVYVRHLRAKFDTGRAASVITTVRGAGYKFDAEAAA